MERVANVFLSTTVRDTDHEEAPYRRLARECLEKGDIAVFLQNHWVVPFADVVKECCRRIGEASGYLGLFGFRYGWRPTPAGPSITELEFDAAWERWRHLSHPPLFVFLAARGSAAARELEAAADHVLSEEFADEADRARSKADQAAFVTRISDMGRIPQPFTDRIDFAQRAAVAVPLYNADLLRHDDRAETRSLIPSSDLGCIGREDQLKALRRLLVTLEGRAPATCVVVHGREGWGQQELLDHLEHWSGWGSAGGPKLGRNREDLATLLAWATRALGGTGLEATLDALAEAAAAFCERDNAVLLLQQHGLPSLEALHREFWHALFALLGDRMPPKKGRKRLVIVVRHDRPLPAPGPQDPWMTDLAAPAFDKLVALPECTALTEADVVNWLFEQELPLAAAEIGAIARRATTDPEGEPDGTPYLVYQRVRDALPNWADLVAGGDR